jgi:Spy/CpxP family protein refolding chaperone
MKRVVRWLVGAVLFLSLLSIAPAGVALATNVPKDPPKKEEPKKEEPKKEEQKQEETNKDPKQEKQCREVRYPCGSHQECPEGNNGLCWDVPDWCTRTECD